MYLQHSQQSYWFEMDGHTKLHVMYIYINKCLSPNMNDRQNIIVKHSPQKYCFDNNHLELIQCITLHYSAFTLPKYRYNTLGTDRPTVTQLAFISTEGLQPSLLVSVPTPEPLYQNGSLQLYRSCFFFLLRYFSDFPV